jgi:hypothetical protein
MSIQSHVKIKNLNERDLQARSESHAMDMLSQVNPIKKSGRPQAA